MTSSIFLRVSIVSAISLSMVFPHPVHAKDGEGTKKALVIGAAAALIGVATMSHHKGHYDRDHRYDSDRDKAEFERGYRDGLYNSGRNNYRDSDAYSDGYRAGLQDRDHRVSYNRDNYWEPDRHVSSRQILHRAAREADNHWDLPEGSSTPLSSRYSDRSGHYHVQVAAGYLRGECVLDSNGNYVRFENR